MNVVIAFIALLGLSLLSGGGVVAYRWNRARTGAAVAGNRLEWPASLTGPDTQAGRI